MRLYAACYRLAALHHARKYNPSASKDRLPIVRIKKDYGINPQATFKN
jgi:hypothetical protein